MPIHIKGSGGMTEAPEILVGSDGLITAKAGAKETTLQLSSAHDPDFIPSNIKKGENIFGLLGEYVGAIITTITCTSSKANNYLTIPADKVAGFSGIISIDVTSPKKMSGSSDVFTHGLFVSKYISETISGTTMHGYLGVSGVYSPGTDSYMVDEEIVLSKEANGDYHLGLSGYATYPNTTYTLTVIGF